MDPVVKRRFLLLALCLPLLACFPRKLVTRPALAVTVLDNAGAPVPGAVVAIHWWSYPYGRHEQSNHFAADAAGLVAAPEVSRSETVAPLCMHGVPEHHYTLCVGAPGHGFFEAEIDPDTGGSLTVRLPAGTYNGECATWQQFRRPPATAAPTPTTTPTP